MNTSHTDQDFRTLIHTRHVTCTGYARKDGLFDIEARMQDVKPDAVLIPFIDTTVPAGNPYHEMRIVITIDASLLIHHVEAHTDAGPTADCAEVNPAYAMLKGLRIGPGFKKQVKERVGGIHGCTHLTQLLDSMATTAFQALMEVRHAERRKQQECDPDSPLPKPWVADTCHTYRMDGEVIKLVWPENRRQKA
jgi:Protein of unknown function (DUF2889)